MRSRTFPVFVLVLLGALRASAMDLVWSRGTGQTRCEAAPAVVDVDRDGRPELLTVNVWGQVMLWALDGTDKGAGQDGTVATLPKDEWSSSPVMVQTRAGTRTILGNGSGLLVCLDGEFKTLWTHQLPGKTQWSRAAPAVFDSSGEACIAIGDLSGAVTCLDLDGNVHWTCAFEGAPVRTYVSTAAIDSAPVLFVAAGENVHCLGANGALRWTAHLGGQLLARPEPMTIDGAQRVVCANALGDIVALDTAGHELWRAKTGAEIDASIVYWPDSERPLIVCTGLWGDVMALNVDGTPAWRHVFRAKNRARPLIADADGDGTDELIVAAYNQHVYAFDRAGRCVDDVRVSGSVNASPIAVPNGRAGNDIVVVSTVLQAHRFAPGRAKPTYADAVPEKGRVRARLADANTVIVDNPAGRFVRVNVSVEDENGRCWFSRLSAADSIVLPFPPGLHDCSDQPGDGPRCDVEIAGAGIVMNKTLRTKAPRAPAALPRMWALSPFAALAAPITREKHARDTVHVGPLYRGETDQGAFVVRAEKDAFDARIALDAPVRSDGTAFGGSLALFRVVEVPTQNGERVHDALTPIDDAIALTPHELAMVWIQADSRDAAPGTYRGRVRVDDAARGAWGALDIVIEVDTLELPPAPLALCTWDYVPNKWFPADAAGAVLDDMQRHGVNVFPRTCAPKAVYDGARLSFDWTALDEDLARLEGRGTLLLHVGPPPPIDFGAGTPANARGVHIAYLHALRDHLFEKGWPYETWALYPVDEPGLDYGGNADRQVEAGQLFREADPRMRIYTDPVPGLSQRDYERIAPYVDVWAPNLRLLTGALVQDARMRGILASGGPVWSYECVSQVRSLSPLCYNRAAAWRADYFGIDGIGFWTHSTTQLDPWTSDPAKNDEYALVYPGAAPVSSVRWEAVRDGIEDVGAVRLLEDVIANAHAQHPRAMAVRNAEDVLRRARTYVMELADEASVESRDFLKKGDRWIWHTDYDAAAFARFRREIAAATHALEHLKLE